MLLVDNKWLGCFLYEGRVNKLGGMVHSDAEYNISIEKWK